MLRQLDSTLLGITALLVSAGLLVAAVPTTRVETAPAPLTIEYDCPYAKLVIVSEPLA
jgi:hypothetical protein